MNDTILNSGLAMAMEFGAAWLQPIQSRLGAQFNQLSPGELDEYDRTCRAAMTFGHGQAAIQSRAASGNGKDAFRSFTNAVLERYPWITPANLDHLFSQGRYYAWKDGELP